MTTQTRHRIRMAIATLPLAGALFAGAASASPAVPARMDYGTLAMNADRTVVVDGHTRYVNVTNGETVRFDVNGKQFSFAFDAWPTIGEVDLSVIAPDGVMAPPVRVYIAPNPLGQG